MIISTQEQQIKDKRQLNDVRDSVQFISDKFKESEEDWVKPSIRSQGFKVSKIEKQADQQEQYSRRNCLLVHEIKEVRGEKTDGIIIEQNLDIDISLLLLLKTIFGCWFS